MESVAEYKSYEQILKTQPLDILTNLAFVFFIIFILLYYVQLITTNFPKKGIMNIAKRISPAIIGITFGFILFSCTVDPLITAILDPLVQDIFDKMISVPVYRNPLPFLAYTLLYIVPITVTIVGIAALAIFTKQAFEDKDKISKKEGLIIILMILTLILTSYYPHIITSLNSIF